MSKSGAQDLSNDNSCNPNNSFGRFSSDINILFLNVQGFKNKITVLESFLSKFQNILAICLVEHWLDENDISLSSPCNYHCASAFSRKNRIRGGTAIFLHNGFEARECEVNSFCQELHFEASATFVDELKLIVVSLYHSPAGNPLIFLDCTENFLNYISRWSNYNIIIGGDLNINFDVSTNKKTVKCLLDLMRQYNFYYLNKSPTRGKNCLDNVFVKNQRMNVTVNKFEFPYSDHDGLMVNILKDKNVNEISGSQQISRFQEDTIKFVIPQHKLELLNSNLSSYDWSCVLFTSGQMGAQDLFTMFFSILQNNINLVRVVKRSKNNNSKKIFTKNKNCMDGWYTNELNQMKQRLLFLHSIIKNTHNKDVVILEGKYTELKKRYKQSVIDAKKIHAVKYITNSSNKCTAAWNLIKDNCNLVKEKKTDIDPEQFNMFFVNCIESVKQQIDKVNLNQTFEDYVKVINTNPANFTWSPISSSHIINAAKIMKNSNSLDIYGMSNNLLKSIIRNIAGPFAHCINELFNEGVFPDSLKISRVCPIYKKGPINLPESYRPISIIPIVSKIIEIIVYEQVSQYFEVNNLFNKSQFGFRKGKSCSDALDNLLRQVYSAFENKDFAQVTFCDLSKAFDSVNHSQLITKLSYYGFKGSALNFFLSYLSNRRQVVCINNKWSNMIELKWGVPQGSVLGPLLFLISINDLPISINVTSILYADDTTFISAHKDFEELNRLVNNTLTDATNWFNSNGFLLNKDKTKNILFSLKSKSNLDPSNLNYASDAKFLGVHVDSNLNWSTHVNTLNTRLSRIVYLLSRLKLVVPNDYIRTAYFGYFQSVLRYGLIFWGNCNRIKEILTLQKKVIRIITDSDYREHCKPIFIKLKIQTVINLYLFDLIIYLLKNGSLITPCDKIHTYNTRKQKNAVIPFYRLSKSVNSHMVLSLKVYNVMLPQINKYSEKTFKTKFYGWLLENPFYDIEEFFDSNIVF